MLLTVTVIGAYVGEKLLGNFEDTEGNKVWEAMDRIPDLFDRGTVGGADEEVQAKWQKLPTGTVEETLEAAKDQHFIEDYTIEKNATAVAEYWPLYQDKFKVNFYNLLEQCKEDYNVNDEDYQRVFHANWDSEIETWLAPVIADSFNENPHFWNLTDKTTVINCADLDAITAFGFYGNGTLNWEEFRDRVGRFLISYSEDEFAHALMNDAHEAVLGFYGYSPSAWNAFLLKLPVLAKQGYDEVSHAIATEGPDSGYANDPGEDSQSWVESHLGKIQSAWDEAVEQIKTVFNTSTMTYSEDEFADALSDYVYENLERRDILLAGAWDVFRVKLPAIAQQGYEDVRNAIATKGSGSGYIGDPGHDAQFWAQINWVKIEPVWDTAVEQFKETYPDDNGWLKHYATTFRLTFMDAVQNWLADQGITPEDYYAVRKQVWEDEAHEWAEQQAQAGFKRISKPYDLDKVDEQVKKDTADAYSAYTHAGGPIDWDGLKEAIEHRLIRYSENDLFTAFEDSFGRYLDDPSVSRVEDEEVRLRAWDRFFFGGGVAKISAVAYEAIKADLFDSGADSRFENDANADATKWIDDHWDDIMDKWQEAVEEVQ